MSRQSRGGTGSAPPSNIGAGVPVPVVQQAQQYLEENIKAWMQPSQAQGSRETMAPLPLTSMTSPAETYSAYQQSLSRVLNSGASVSGLGGITHQALQEHNNIVLQHQRATPPPPAPPQFPRVPPLTSPSSGYSEHSDPYLALSLAGACDSSDPSSKAAFPHSLSFSGCSQHSLLQGTSYSSPCGNSFGITQPSAAASFFARAAQRLNLSSKKKRRVYHPSDPERPIFRTNFSDIIKLSPPPVPPGLLRSTGRKDGAGVGKVKVMLRIFPSHEVSSTDATYMTVDNRKKQLTLYDPTICGSEPTAERHAGVAAPKMFAFDAVFSPDDNQAEVCSSSLCDVISSVVGGTDGCLFVYGHSKLGKTSTMVGNSNSVQELGVIPCAIWWLFRAINEQKHKSGARFSVRVSAVEVSGKTEELRDLLADYAAGTEGSGTSPGVYLRDDPVFGTQLMNQSELRAPTAERAAYLLDAALAARSADCEEDARNAHFLFTLHVYQYRVEKGGRGGVAGGRSRLHLFDLGSCEKLNKSRDGTAGGCLSLSALGNVILALFNGQKHVPYKESKLTQLLREAVGSVTCRAAMIAHVSSTPSRYPETLATLQLASRIHRLRRKKLKFTSPGDVASSDDRGVCRPFVRVHAVGEDGVRSGSSDPDYTSSSEQSCDTVIFVGSVRGQALPEHNLGNNDKQSAPSASPLAKDPRSANATDIPPSTSSPRRQASKTHSNGHHQHHQMKGAGTITSTSGGNVASVPPTRDERTADSVNVKSALYNPEQVPKVWSSSGNITAPPKKKMASTSAHSSPKHQRAVDSVACSGSGPPKVSKYATIDISHASEAKKSKHSTDSTLKGTLKSVKTNFVDPSSKPLPSSSTIPNVPQSPRKSKRSHKQDHNGSNGIHGHTQQQPQQQISQQQQQQQMSQQQQQQQNLASSSGKVLPSKDAKLASDETWIDGPRFTKPKFDSRTLHQLQKEKWVDGPGMYGYMDVQKETMIRKWVEDHSRHVPENNDESTKEVWIDFPPNSDDKSLINGILEKYVPSSSNEGNTEKHAIASSTELSKRDSKNKINDRHSHQIVVEVETHHYAKPNNVSGFKQKQSLASGDSLYVHSSSHSGEDAKHTEMHNKSSEDSVRGTSYSGENNINGNVTVQKLGLSDAYNNKGIDDVSSSSAELNEMDNDSDDQSFSGKLSGSRLMGSSVDVSMQMPDETGSDDEHALMVESIEPEDSVQMVDSCIQVTEEDIFLSCGWQEESILSDHPNLGEVDSYDGNEHPLRILSAEDLHLASSFTDSRAMSVDLDSISVPETWKGTMDELDPSLTWRLLRGSVLPPTKEKRKRDQQRVIAVNEDLALKSNMLTAKLEKLARLRELIDRTSGNRHGNNKWEPLPMSEKLNSLPCRGQRLTMSDMLYHSADSSLEELRENDANSIHSEPAELDLEKLDFQFNIKPMNGLRLEAFYNRIHKVPLFPECITHFGKPTQVVPPIIKRATKSPVPNEDLKSFRNRLGGSSDKLEKEESHRSPSRMQKRWSASLRHPDGSSNPELNKHPSMTELTEKVTGGSSSNISGSSENLRLVGNGVPLSELQDKRFKSSEWGRVENPHRPLAEIILEQRCRTYSEGPTTSPAPVHHSSRQSPNHKASKSCKVFSETSNTRGSDMVDLRYENITHNKHPRKKASPKLPPRVLGNGSSNHSNRCGQNRLSKQQNGSYNPSNQVTPPAATTVIPPPMAVTMETMSNSHARHQQVQLGVSSSMSWTQSHSGGLINAPYVMQSHYDTTDLAQVHRNHILSRSTSTPTSPFVNRDPASHLCAHSDSVMNAGAYSFVCGSATTVSTTTVITNASMTPNTAVKKESKWGARQSSSGHGSDSSVISADIKETKELLGKLPKGQQFSGTSSGYESMPRDSEGTPLSSSSQESSSEVGGKRETRGRKGTRKKSQSSSKRSRSVPARAPVTNSPTWQQLPVPVARQPMRGRGRLVRDLHDPSLWKSEEDVCCTSLLCCRLLDFY